MLLAIVTREILCKLVLRKEVPFHGSILHPGLWHRSVGWHRKNQRKEQRLKEKGRIYNSAIIASCIQVQIKKSSTHSKGSSMFNVLQHGKTPVKI